MIALDRFGSMTVFYAQTESNELVASTGYQSLLRILKKNDAGGLQESSIFEFLYMRRLFGEKTYHSGIRRMSAGTTLRFSFATSQIEKENYWSPPKEKLLGQEEVISSLTHGINESIEMYLSGPGCRHGLLLSGGLDSRMLLAVGRERYTTFTTARTMNNEVEVASSLADQVGAEHIYLQRQESYFADIFSRATVLSNAMTAFYECQFVGFQDELSKHVDVIHTGLFLDVFFCGHYLYKEHPQFLGRPRLDFQLRELVNGSEERNFLDNISYRLKTSSVLDVCDNRRADELRASLSRSIENKMKDGREYGFAGHDLWEYMHLTDLGRHYSMLMVASLKGRLGIAVPALENNLYDLAFMIPAEMKVNWSIYLQTLRKLSNSFSRIRSANNNISPRYPLRVQAGLNIGRSALRRFGILRTAGMPVPEDRSWPRLSSDLMHPNIRKKLESMVKEGKINDLTFIVPEKIEKAITKKTKAIMPISMEDTITACCLGYYSR